MAQQVVLEIFAWFSCAPASILRSGDGRPIEIMLQISVGLLCGQFTWIADRTLRRAKLAVPAARMRPGVAISLALRILRAQGKPGAGCTRKAAVCEM
jgi:hypothetical protein